MSQNLAPLLFTALLNIADFVSDWYVVLKYGCLIDSTLSTGCGSEQELTSCEAHPWWFGIGLFLLIASNLAQSYLWASPNELRMMILLHRCGCSWPESSKQLLAFRLLFLLAFMQLHYLVDILFACGWGEVLVPVQGSRLSLHGMEDGEWESAKKAIRSRELATKLLESGPQLYLQSYVLFAVGSHREPVNVISVSISALALGHGILKVMDENPCKTWNLVYRRLLAFMWLASDQAMRAAGYALVLSPSARPYGITLVVVASATICGLHIWNDVTWGVCGNFRDFIHFFYEAAFKMYLIPVMALERLEIFTTLAVAVRFFEMATFALVAYACARTKCGHRPTNEVLGLVSLLMFNVVCFGILYFCFDEETGNDDENDKFLMPSATVQALLVQRIDMCC